MQKTLLYTLIGGALLISPSVSAQLLKQTSKGFGITKVLTTVSKPAKAKANKTTLKAAEAAITPDWTVDMNLPEEFEKFTVIDANNDALDAAGVYKQETWTNNGSQTFLYPFSNDADDWLVTPALNLKGGQTYKVVLTLDCFMDTHKLEVKWGSQPTVAGLTEVGAAPTAIPEGKSEFEAVVTPQTDGVYYVGIHGMSAKYSFNLYLSKLQVKAAAAATTPAAVSDVTVTPDATAKLEAAITFTPPTKTIGGDALTDLKGVKIKRGDTQIADLTDVVAGQPYTYTDKTVAEGGMQTYTITPYSDNGDGEETKVERWVGLDLPTASSKPVLSESETSSLHLAWEPFKAANDGVIFPDGITYDIYGVEISGGQAYMTQKEGSVTGVTEFDSDTNTDEGEQQFTYLALTAKNDAGASESAWLSNPVLTGKPYTVPVREEVGTSLNTFWSLSQTGNGSLMNPAAGVDIDTGNDADGSGGFFTMRTVLNDVVTLEGGKVNLSGLENPTLTFKIKSGATGGTFIPFVESPDGIRVQLEEQELTAKTSIWSTKQYALKNYIGDWLNKKWVRIGFTLSDPDGSSVQELYLDDVNIDDIKPVDLAVAIEELPESLEKGQTVQIPVKVRNYGSTAVSSYKLTLTANGKVVSESQVGRRINSFGHNEFDLEYTPAITELADDIDLKVEVTQADDAVADNNAATAKLHLTWPDLTPATNLAVTKTSTANTLAWTAPAAKVTQTENFDEATPWAVENIGKWSFVDGDQGYCFGLLDNYQVYYDSEMDPFAFTVYNPTQYGGYDITPLLPESAKPKSGDQSLAAFYSATVDLESGDAELVDADNWAISPELSGEAQEVSLWANNYNESGEDEDGAYEYDYPETFDLLYSTGGTDVDDFIKIGETHTQSGGQWTEYKAQVPAGAKYFAIHHNSKATFDEEGYIISPYLFQIDDVSFTTANLPIVKYNVYRDGQLIGSSTTATFTDNDATSGDHVYQVTVVYEGNRESRPVNYGVATGIDTVTTAGTAANTVEGIFTIDGKKVEKTVRGLNIVKLKDGSVRKILK